VNGNEAIYKGSLLFVCMSHRTGVLSKAIYLKEPKWAKLKMNSAGHVGYKVSGCGCLGFQEKHSLPHDQAGASAAN
jgi:hypothetical protein